MPCQAPPVPNVTNPTPPTVPAAGLVLTVTVTVTHPLLPVYPVPLYTRLPYSTTIISPKSGGPLVAGEETQDLRPCPVAIRKPEKLPKRVNISGFAGKAVETPWRVTFLKLLTGYLFYWLGVPVTDLLSGSRAAAAARCAAASGTGTVPTLLAPDHLNNLIHDAASPLFYANIGATRPALRTNESGTELRLHIEQ
jgi:hypothetical protein